MGHQIKSALEAMENSRSEAEIVGRLKGIGSKALADPLQAAKDNEIAFHTAIKPLEQQQTSPSWMGLFHHSCCLECSPRSRPHTSSKPFAWS
jgi:hypothetical protein